jgi:AraC-like DNA-binding protein
MAAGSRVRIAIDGITATAPVRVRRQAWELQPLFALLQAASPAPDPVRLRALTALILSGLADPARPPAATAGLTAAQRAAVTARVSLWRTQGFPAPADLARAAGLGGDWFARSFRRSHGTSPRVWLGQERIRLAQADLLAGDVPAAAVARRLGYRHYAQFARAFRSATGMAPEAWRDRRGVPRQRQRHHKSLF